MTKAIKSSQFKPQILDNDAFTQLFKDQLGTMHSALSHLSLNLPSLADQASFKDLRFAVEECLEDTNRQIVRVEQIAAVFNVSISEENCLGMKSIVEETYVAISGTETQSLACDMALIFYLHIIKHIEIAAYRTLLLAAAKLGYDQAKMLLTENMDEAKDNDKLFLLISKQYLLN
jgi:ferritin-like metal-binding protein YciE